MNEDIQDNVDQTNTPEHTEVELRAMEMGWRPLSEFSGDEDDFVEAKEFINRKPLFDKIEYQSKQLKAVSKALESLKVHYTKVQETEYEKALTSLKAERRRALTEGDGDRFEAVDEQIKDAESELNHVKQLQKEAIVEQPNEPHPEFKSWLDKNQWYSTVGYMRAFADDIGSKLAAQGLSPSDVLVKVRDAVKTEFPQKFRNPNKENAPDVGDSRSSKASGNKGNAAEAGLTEQERKIMNDLVRTGVMSKEKYLADLQAIKTRS